MNSQPTYKVCVWCITYNHAPYITSAMDGVCQQQTRFPYICTIFDDASTDGEPEVIEKYLHDHFNTEETKETGDYRLTIGRHQENKNCYFAVFLLKYNHHSLGKSRRAYYKDLIAGVDYVAFCEGDDYWTDVLKLQKQVDFLEEHPDYNLYCHDWAVLTETGLQDSPIHNKYRTPFSFTFATLPWIWITKTVTTMFRLSAIDFGATDRYQYARDVHLVYYALKEGKGYYSPEVMATYRVHNGGVWSKVDLNERNRITYALYKELYAYEPNKAVRKRYMNATLAYFNGLAFGKKTLWHFGTNAKLYFEALRNISDVKDIVFCLGGLVPTSLVKWVMKTFKV